jgi:zinc/manganese transport system substrate-binding protein
VVIPNGQDPHDYAPSAQDVEQMNGAALVVANGLALEEGMEDVLDTLSHDGVPVFYATDHVELRELGADEQAIEEAAHEDEAAHDEEAGHEEDAGHDDEHAHGSDDPHLWTDPVTMAAMATALAAELETVLGVQLDDRLAAFEAEMVSLDAEVRDIMSAVPAGECRLVTGHESLGYFADRYGCELIGAVIPSLSSTAETSAKDLSELLEVTEAAGVRAIFTEVGTPQAVAEQVAAEVGVPLVELPSHNLPETGGYQAFVVELATKVAAGLTGAA